MLVANALLVNDAHGSAIINGCHSYSGTAVVHYRTIAIATHTLY